MPRSCSFVLCPIKMKMTQKLVLLQMALSGVPQKLSLVVWERRKVPAADRPRKETWMPERELQALRQVGCFSWTAKGRKNISGKFTWSEKSSGCQTGLVVLSIPRASTVTSTGSSVIPTQEAADVWDRPELRPVPALGRERPCWRPRHLCLGKEVVLSHCGKRLTGVVLNPCGRTIIRFLTQ